MDRKTEEGIWKVKEEIYKRASVSSTRFRFKLKMEVDVLDYIIRGVFLIEFEDGQWRPVAYLSKSLNEIEKNYEIYDKEMLAMIRGLENWRHLLEGTKFKFKVWTDHKNSEYFIKV